MIETAVLDFLESLDPGQRRRAVLPFESPERQDWHYIPKDRAGLALRDMSDGQRHEAMTILRVALSERGYKTCEQIRALEPLVAEMEDDRETYDPANYVLVVFGTPGNGAPWAWRFEGHHLSLNFVHAPEGVTVTPTFFGANPAQIEHGERAGLRVLGAEEDLGRRLIRGFDERRRRQALLSTQAFEDILTGPGREKSLRQPEGVALADMDEGERTVATVLIDQFLGAMRADIADGERRRLREAGLEHVRFAWAGSLEPRQPHYYRLHGPTLVVEYDNTQNDANHIHSVWHDPQRDFGADLLRRHYEHPSHQRGATHAHAAAHRH